MNRRASQRVDYSSYLHEDEDEEGIRYADNEMPHEPRKEVKFTPPNYLLFHYIITLTRRQNGPHVSASKSPFSGVNNARQPPAQKVESNFLNYQNKHFHNVNPDSVRPAESSESEGVSAGGLFQLSARGRGRAAGALRERTVPRSAQPARSGPQEGDPPLPLFPYSF